MKSYKYYSTLTLVIASLFVGCKKDWLEAKANKNQSVPTTLSDFQSMLDFSGLVMNVNSFALGEIAADGHYVTEAAWTSATTSASRNAYTWSLNTPYLDLDTWRDTYERVYYSNVVLNGLSNYLIKNELEIETYNNIKGQALFNRAEAFHMLSQLYAIPYNKTTSETDLGIPIRLSSDVTEKSTRSSVEQTYNQIIKDLLEAENLLPLTPIYPTRGSKPALYGLLARVYMTMNDYENCLKYADKSLQLRSELLDYNSKSQNANFIGGFNTNPANPEILFHMTMYTSEISGFLTTNYLVDQALYNQYHPDDLRRVLFFRNNANGTKSYKGNYFNSTTNMFTGIGTDETYLMRAECYARMGNTVAAMNDLNSLIKKRWRNTVVFVPFSAINPEDALSKILIERRKELIMRGLRWSDLRRLNVDERFKQTLTRTIGGVNYILEPGSYKYTFPIPNDILDYSGMPQTPGW
ncbi:MAG TPA: RagB/SusD family nutrient uptake outer membrane protein [Pedobacter sp.]|uniref:RagB/SusD family nutrient uptake outer membrane protein n=1 Tax=Pedobacter sp. TaxID=1411316 RepID=UPI002C0034D1|nr:RagB/SusD family nutrient uptake outer membrane protein [Pedobacter sp.]HMI03107.1 RagB/SusD family nutrient uptake outer membrane protein [Pedobacter sp.]